MIRKSNDSYSFFQILYYKFIASELTHDAPLWSMNPEHASITGRPFFSRAEKNQKAQRRREKPYGEDCRAETPQLCSHLACFSQGACHPDGNSRGTDGRAWDKLK